MKHSLKMLLAAATVVMMSACSSAPAADDQTGDAKQEETAFTAGNELQQAFKDNGFNVTEVVPEGTHDVHFNVDNDLGGANVAIIQYSDKAAATDTNDNMNAQFTQEDYYSNQEINNDDISLSTFTNSINNNEAILVLVRADNVVIRVSEIDAGNTDAVMKALASYNPAIKAE